MTTTPMAEAQWRDTAVPSSAPERSLEEIGRELGTLAATIAATTCRFLLLLAEFDRREGWAGRGVTSASHWLSWRCGISATTAREQVRVARRLVELPQTIERFAVGQLSYSKVRAITRIATADTEEELLAIAEAATANQLDRFVAGVSRATSVDEINARHSARYLSFRTEDDGTVSFSGRCSPEDGAAILERLRLVQDFLVSTATADARHSTDERPLALDEPVVRQGRALIDALVLLCEQADVGSRAEPTSAEEAIGSRRSETVLHVTLDELSDAAARGRGASAEASGVRIGTRLEMGPALHPSTARRLCCDTGLLLSVHDDDKGQVRLMPNARTGGALRLGRRRRLASRAQLRALWDRDHGCRFPGCERRIYLHAHHVVHWADGGPTDLDNLVLLCGQHHRMLHEGGYAVALDRDRVTVSDAQGRVLAPVPAPVPPGAATPGQPVAHAHTDAYPLDPLNGGPLSLDHAVGVVAERWQLRSA